MPPRTRSAANKAIDGIPSPLLQSSSGFANGSTPGHADSESFEGLLERALHKFKEVERQRDDLRERNQKLKDKSRRSVRLTPKHAEGLQHRNKFLEEQHKKDLARIKRVSKDCIHCITTMLMSCQRAREKLRDREVKVDADELMEDSHLASANKDVEHIMTKLLRRFSDLMAAPTVETKADIDCVICFQSLPMIDFQFSACDHHFCRSCLESLLKDTAAEGTVACPSCRKPLTRESFQPLQYTESERWDELLKVATDWARLDAPDLDVEVTETEENIQEDSSSLSEPESTMSDTVSSNNNETEMTTTGQPPDYPVTPPPVPAQRASYSNSTIRERRDRLAQLVKDREQKKRGQR